MNISVIIIIFLLCIIGFLMIYNSMAMHESSAFIIKWIVIIIGILCLCSGIYLFFKYLFNF